MTESVLVLAAALLLRLGFSFRPVAVDGPDPVAPPVPLVAAASSWAPLRSLGLPGDCPPIVGGEP